MKQQQVYCNCLIAFPIQIQRSYLCTVKQLPIIKLLKSMSLIEAIIGSDNGLASGRREAIIWTNLGVLLIGSSGTNFSEILSEIHTSPSNNILLKIVVCEMAAFSSRPQCANLTRHRAWRDLVANSDVRGHKQDKATRFCCFSITQSTKNVYRLTAKYS